MVPKEVRPFSDKRLGSRVVGRQLISALLDRLGVDQDEGEAVAGRLPTCIPAATVTSIPSCEASGCAIIGRLKEPPQRRCDGDQVPYIGRG